MHALEALRVAASAIRKNLLRSLLAALGIVIAVAAVVATITALAGVRRNMEASMSSMGTNLVYVFAGSSKARGASGGVGSGRPLSLGDGQAIVRELSPWVRELAPFVRVTAQVVAGGRNWNSTAMGTTEAYASIRPGRLAYGRFLTAEDELEGRKVCVLGYTVAHELFGEANAEGQSVRVGGMPCRVVGALAKKGQAGWQNQDDVVFVPFPTATRRLYNLAAGGLTFLVSAHNAQLTDAMQDELRALLRARHRLAEGQPNDFSLFNMQEAQDSYRDQMRTFSLVMAAVAVISLVVGAIGVANVMLVSVTERTREIGLRIAVGARRRDVRRQFLVESMLLCILGGTLGVAAGVGISVVLSFYGDWPVVLDAGVVALALLGAGTVGVLAGFYPAFRASRLDPIEALRFE